MQLYLNMILINMRNLAPSMNQISRLRKQLLNDSQYAHFELDFFIISFSISLNLFSSKSRLLSMIPLVRFIQRIKIMQKTSITSYNTSQNQNDTKLYLLTNQIMKMYRNSRDCEAVNRINLFIYTSSYTPGTCGLF